MIIAILFIIAIVLVIILLAVLLKNKPKTFFGASEYNTNNNNSYNTNNNNNYNTNNKNKYNANNNNKNNNSVASTTVINTVNKTNTNNSGASTTVINIPKDASQEAIDSYHHMLGMANRKWAKNGKMPLEKALKIFNPISLRKFYDLSRTVFSEDYIKNINVRSKLFEEKIQKILGPRVYKTEADLKGEPLTPDFLVKDFGDIKWIDAKNYPHFDSVLTKHKLIKQSAKYTAAFGPGMFVFNGVWCDVPILDTKIVDIKELEKMCK